MTALCGGGTSSAQPQFGDVVYVLPSALGAFLNKIPTVWAVGAAGYIGKINFNLATFCTTDPPAVPTFTAQDVIDIFNPYNPFTYTNAQQKFQDLVGAFMWHDLCKCDNGTIPTLPTPPAEPAGAPDINPPTVTPAYPTGTPCQTINQSGTAHNGDADTTLGKYPLDGATYATIDFSSPVVHTTSGQFGFDLRWYNASGTLLSGTLFAGVATTGDFTHVVGAAPSGATQFDFFYGPSGALVPSTLPWQASINLYCGTTPGAPGGDVPQPCPADPFVQATLDQILALVTLIQRQAAPFAYIAGAAHTGLTGQGSFAVQGLLGARVEITDFGFNTGMEAGDPDELWHAGWVNWGNADGVSPRQFLSNAQTLTLPSLAGQYTELHYSLAPGVTATVTELEREP